MSFLFKRKSFVTFMLILLSCLQASCVVNAYAGNSSIGLFPGVGLDRSISLTPLNPAAYSSIEKLKVREEWPRPPLTLFQRPGREIPRVTVSEEESAWTLEASPVFSFPLGFALSLHMNMSDLQAVKIGRKLMEYPSFWEIDEGQQSEFLHLFADMIERVPFTFAAKGQAVIVSDRYSLKYESFVESSVLFTTKATYRFLTENGSTYGFSIGRFIGGKRLPLALGLTIKHISKNRDLMTLDVSEGVTEFIGSGEGVGFDLAALLKVSNSSNFGIIVENVGTWLKWNGIRFDKSGVIHDYSQTEKESLLYRIGFSEVSEGRILTVDLEIRPDAVATNALSRICFAYGTKLLNDRLILSFSGSSDIKRRMVVGGSIDYKWGKGRIGFQLGTADFFKNSIVLGCIMGGEF